MTVRIDQIADAIISAPGSFVKVSESIGTGGDIIIDSDVWAQFMPRAGSKDFYIPVAGKYRIDLDFMCFVDGISGNGTFSFKIIVDDDELNEQEIGNLEDWRYRTDFVDGYSQQHFVSSAELSAGTHTLKVYGRRMPESSGGIIYISQDIGGETPRATSVIFHAIKIGRAHV